MATIANRYYNSPWIAQAGANLASALAPPDPEKQLAAQRAKWVFEQQQEQARLAAEDRTAMLAGNESISALMADAGTQQATPGSPGEAQYFREHPEAAGPVGMDDATYQQHVQTALRGGRPLADVVTASGPRGAAWNARLGFLDQKSLDAMGLQHVKGQQAYDRTALGVGGANWRAEGGWELARDLQRANEEKDIELQKLRGAQKLEEIGAGATVKPPLDVSHADARANIENTEDWYAALAGPNLEGKYSGMPADVLAAVTDYTDWLYQQSRNSSTASTEAREFFFDKEPKVTKPYDSWFFDPFHADVDEPSVALRGGKTLGELQMEIEAIKARAGAPAQNVQAPGGGVPPVPVNSPEEASQLQSGTRFIIASGPRAGQTGTVP